MDEANQKKKMLLSGIIITVVLFVVILIILMVLMAQESKKTKIAFGGNVYKTKTVDMTAEDGKVYMQKSINYNGKETPILVVTPDGKEYFCLESLALMTGYKYNKGAYGELDENTNKCYIDNGGEYVTFSTESDSIAKDIKSSEKYEGELAGKKYNTSLSESSNKEIEDEELFTLDKPVIKFADGKLYASIDAISNGFNMIVSKENSLITLYTLEDLIKTYGDFVVSEGYTLTTNFKNQRALCKGLAVVGNDGKYGVIKVDGDKYENVISTKYDTVEYAQSIGEFIVSISGKYGMMAPGEQHPTIASDYDSIQLLDAEEKLYIVELDKRFGVVNAKGEVIIPTEYDQIGLSNIEAYKNQGIRSKYLIMDSCIPVMRDGKYGLFSKEGYTLAKTNYTSIGCENPDELIENKSARPTLTVPLSKDITCLVFSMQNNAGTTTYGMMTTDGTIVCQAYYTAIYYITSGGKSTYFFNKVNNDELLTLDELINTRPTLKNLIENENYQKKSQKQLEEDTKKQQEEMQNLNEFTEENSEEQED